MCNFYLHFSFTSSHLNLEWALDPPLIIIPIQTRSFPLCCSSSVHPLVIAAHPSEPNEYALGLSDGGVHVFEPLESENKWGVPPPVENGSASSMAATPSVGAPGSEQAQR